MCKFIGCEECYDNLENKKCFNGCKKDIKYYIKI